MKNSLQEITINGYRTYIVLIDYDRNLPKKFRNRFLKIKENKAHLLCKKGLYDNKATDSSDNCTTLFFFFKQ